jgi:hypothetical protein
MSTPTATIMKNKKEMHEGERLRKSEKVNLTLLSEDTWTYRATGGGGVRGMQVGRGEDTKQGGLLARSGMRRVDQTGKMPILFLFLPARLRST